MRPGRRRQRLILVTKTIIQQEAFRERRHLHDCDLWPWAYGIRCCLLYCTLVPGMMSVSVIVCEIWPFVHFCYLWPSPVTFIVRQGHNSRSKITDVVSAFSKCFLSCLFYFLVEEKGQFSHSRSCLNLAKSRGFWFEWIGSGKSVDWF